MALSKPLLLQFNQTFYYGCFHLNGPIQTTKYLLFFILSSAEWKKKSFHGCRFSIQSINNHLVPRSDSNPKERFDACRTFNLPILFRNKTFSHIQLSDLNVLNQYIRCCIKTNCYVLVLFDWVLNHFFLPFFIVVCKILLFDWWALIWVGSLMNTQCNALSCRHVCLSVSAHVLTARVYIYIAYNTGCNAVYAICIQN